MRQYLPVRRRFRTIEEISRWATMSDQERRAIMAGLPARIERFDKAEGEHA
ncbi:MAG: DUF1289 domain-containing protein [Methyloceanibacter sp.]|uniref:DUF1289 domain-containing protein n=1 Tax=Methyloceanibacter sp. TaxID=1965321 RepID=UPI003D9B4EBB